MNKKLLTLIAVAAVPFVMQAGLVDFNGGSELANAFTSDSDFSQSATGGLDNSGSVTLTGNSGLEVFKPAFDASALSGDTISTYFKYNGADEDGRPFFIGFTSGVGDTYSSSATTTGTDFRVILIGDASNDGDPLPNVDNMYGISIHNNNTQVDATNTDVELVTDNWYFLELTIGGVSGGNFTGISAQLFNSDNSGNIGSSLKFLNNGGSNYTAASSLTSDTEAYAFFGGQNPTSRGASVVDNFGGTVIIPEPSTFALVGIALGALMLFRRRK